MKPERAIELLKKLVEYRAKNSKNAEYTLELQDAVNCLIDLYNSQEKQRQEMQDLKWEIDTARSLYYNTSNSLNLILNVVSWSFVDYARQVCRINIYCEMMRRNKKNGADIPDFEQSLREQERQKDEAIERINRMQLYPGHVFTEQEILQIFNEIVEITNNH